MMLGLFKVFAVLSLFFPFSAQGKVYQSSHPRHYGIINDDHGIISAEDLRRADENSPPATLFDGTRTDYPYWQCFDKRYLRFNCNYSEPLNRQGSSLEIDIETEKEIHSYSHAHAISGEVCDEMKHGIKKILRNQRYFCINGINWASNKKLKRTEYFWSLHRIKTKSGYVHFFLPN